MEKINLDSINSMDGHSFEDLIGNLLKKMGFHIEENRGSADGGIDIVAHNYEPIVGGRCIVQCKRYNSPISETMIRDLYGVVTDRKASKGVLITNSTFTSSSMKFADGKPIELIDGNKLIDLIAKYLELADENNDAKEVNLHQQLLIKALAKKASALKKDYDEIQQGAVFVKGQVYKSVEGYIEYVLRDIKDIGSLLKVFNTIIKSINLKPDEENQSENVKLAEKRMKVFCDGLYKSYRLFHFTGHPAGSEGIREATSLTYRAVFSDIFTTIDKCQDILAHPDNYKNENRLEYKCSFTDGYSSGANRVIEEINKARQPRPKSGCFIATACYGYGSEEVCTLQRARDTYLTNSKAGIAFVKFYYQISPPLADLIGNNCVLKFTARILLRPIVYVFKKLLA